MVAPCSVPRVALLLLVLAACAGWCDSAAGQPAARAANSTAADVAALQSLKAAVDGGNTTLSSWKGTNPCGTLAWKGVNCTDGRVTQISLAGLNLTGTLPKEWGMQKLLALDLSNNSLGAGLPGGWDLPALAALALGLNQLTGSLPEAWAAGLPALASLDLRFNNLAGSVPGSWASTGFAPPFTALLQPGKTDGLCGVVFPKPGYSLLYQTLQSNQTHALYGAIGSCQCCNCGQARINGSATNAYDVAWANSIAPTDLGAANSDLQVNVVPAPGTPLTLPCYPSNPPTFFGANAALRGNAWQSSTSGNATAYLAVAGAKAIPQPPGDCSATDAVPGWWMVDLQNADTAVHGVALTVGTPMTDVEVRVGNNVNPAANVRCTAPSNRTLTAGTGAIILCDRLTLKGRYLSVNTSSRVSLCKVQVYPYIANAALGKPTTFSAASGGNEANADKATDGSVATSSCTQIVNDKNLAAWLTIDLLYEAAVEMVVVVNGDSTFNSDLVIRLGNSPVVRGDENGVCSLNQSLAPRKTLPVQCDGRGRYLTLYRKAPGASDLYICEVFAYLKEGPTGFLGSTAAPSPAPAPSPTSPAPSPPPATVISVTINTVEMEVALQLTGPGLVPVTPDVQQQIAAALSNSWTTIDGVDGCRRGLPHRAGEGAGGRVPGGGAQRGQRHRQLRAGRPDGAGARRRRPAQRERGGHRHHIDCRGRGARCRLAAGPARQRHVWRQQRQRGGDRGGSGGRAGGGGGLGRRLCAVPAAARRRRRRRQPAA